ncbi:OmpA family protein [Minwuia sp.]|uniref:OmpA family protein n=1 Tax=Minwuia sp. TaxID=2493630 RepID=UPI003A8D976B
MFNRSAMAAAALVVMAGSASAEVSGSYLSGGALGAYPTDRTVDNSAANPLDLKFGYGGTGAVGYQFRSGFRIEGEIAYRHHTADRLGNINLDGSINSTSAIANIIWEYDNPSGIYPYIGGGLGGARIGANSVSGAGIATIDDDDFVLAYQGLAGVAFALNPNLSLIAEYRYFRTSEAELTAANGVTVSADYVSHNAMLGLRYRFGAAPSTGGAVQSTAQQAALPVVARAQPPKRIAKTVPKPAPLPVAQARAAASLRKTYLIYFGLDSAALSPEARRTVAEASERAKTDGTAVIELAGHTDRSGDADYNLALSRKRAQNTASEIQRHGVQSRLLIKALGETAPQVPTADGAYEPRNRRVEVVLQGQGDGLSN